MKIITFNEVDSPDEVCALFNEVFSHLASIKDEIRELQKYSAKKASVKEKKK